MPATSEATAFFLSLFVLFIDGSAIFANSISAVSVSVGNTRLSVRCVRSPKALMAGAQLSGVCSRIIFPAPFWRAAKIPFLCALETLRPMRESTAMQSERAKAPASSLIDNISVKHIPLQRTHTMAGCVPYHYTHTQLPK